MFKPSLEALEDRLVLAPIQGTGVVIPQQPTTAQTQSGSGT